MPCKRPSKSLTPRVTACGGDTGEIASSPGPLGNPAPRNDVPQSNLLFTYKLYDFGGFKEKGIAVLRLPMIDRYSGTKTYFLRLTRTVPARYPVPLPPSVPVAILPLRPVRGCSIVTWGEKNTH
jgi:hypothetical protein